MVKNILLCMFITTHVFAQYTQSNIAPTKEQLVSALQKKIESYKIKTLISTVIVMGYVVGFPALHLLIFGNLLTKGVYLYKNPPHITAQQLFPTSPSAQKLYTIISYLGCGISLCSLAAGIYSIYQCYKLNKELKKLKTQEKNSLYEPAPLKEFVPRSTVTLPRVRNGLA